MPRIAVFDVGNVLLDWNPRYLYRKMFSGEAAVESFLAEIAFSTWNLENDRGRAVAENAALLAARFPQHEAAIRAYGPRFQETVPHAIEGTVAILGELKAAGVPLYAITNFSHELFLPTRERYTFLKDFIDVVVSGQERLLKPDAAIYRRLLDRNTLDAADCVFIDDAEKNIVGARAVGMHAVHFTTPDALRRDLVALGLPLAAPFPSG